MTLRERHLGIILKIFNVIHDSLIWLKARFRLFSFIEAPAGYPNKNSNNLDYKEEPLFSLRDSGASETQAKVKITPREKCAFLAMGDFDAHLHFARSTILERK